MSEINSRFRAILSDETVRQIENNLAVLNFKAYQHNGTELNLNFELPNFEESKEKMCGTILNELFRWVKFQKEIKAKGLKLNQPIFIRFEIAGKIFDTGRVKKQTQERLKLQNTDKGRRNYAKIFYATYEYATAPVHAIEYAELIAGLESRIEAAATKAA